MPQSATDLMIVTYLASALAFVGGGGLGAMYSEFVYGNEMPWFAAESAAAVDGDTIRITVLLHLDGMDAPEIDRERCPGEMARGLRARDRANELLAAGPVRVKLTQQDVHGRMGALFTAANRSVGATLLRESLVQQAVAGRWCPDDASTVAPGPVRSTLAGAAGD